MDRSMWVVVVLVLASSGAAAIAAESRAALDLKASEFETWMTHGRDTRKPGEDPRELGAALSTRVDADRMVTDQTVLACLSAFRGFEGEASVKSGVQSYPATRGFIDSTVKQFQHQSQLVAELLRAKAELLNLEGKYGDAVEVFDAAAKEYSRMGLACDRGKIACGVTAGELSHVMKNDAGADARYLEVMSYPWYATRDAEALQDLRDGYLRAVRGLIDVRRNDKTALEQIYVTPAVYGQLLPLIAKAITAAGGDPTSAANLVAMGWNGKRDGR